MLLQLCFVYLSFLGLLYKRQILLLYFVQNRSFAASVTHHEWYKCSESESE